MISRQAHMEFCRSKILSGVPGLFHGYGARVLGNMSMSLGDRAGVAQRRSVLLASFGGKFRAMTIMDSAHGAQVGVVDALPREGSPAIQAFPQSTDALITNLPGVALFNSFADCLPVFLFDAQTRSVGLVHAGWRGVVAGVVSATIAKMNEAYGANPQDLLAFVGPGIHACCFEIKDDVLPQFETLPEAQGAVLRREGKMYVDLQTITARQLEAVGVRQAELSPECTCCEKERYFSYRRDGRVGAQPGVIGLFL